VLPIARSTYYAHAAIARKPELTSDRAKHDIVDAELIMRAYRKSGCRYGARKIWHQLRREGHDIARGTIERLMQALGLAGITCGKKQTTIPDPAQPCPQDRVNRQ
jgi:hypothetical protein